MLRRMHPSVDVPGADAQGQFSKGFRAHLPFPSCSLLGPQDPSFHQRGSFCFFVTTAPLLLRPQTHLR